MNEYHGRGSLTAEEDRYDGLVNRGVMFPDLPQGGGSIIGVDIGQARDYTAVCVIKPTMKDGKRMYHCGYIDRLPLGTLFVDIVERVRYIHSKVGGTVVIDSTGVGAPIVEMARRNIPGEVIGLLITAGEKANGWNIPKRVLITGLQISFQKKELRLKRGLSFGKTLVEELLNYRVTVTSHKNEVFSPWREREHDDLILSLAIGLYCCKKRNPSSGVGSSMSPFMFGRGLSDGR